MSETGRQWQPGDRAWCDGAMWSRRSSLNETWWWSDNSDERTDAEMTTADAVLVATADGPIGHFHEGVTFCEGCIRASVRMAREMITEDASKADS